MTGPSYQMIEKQCRLEKTLNLSEKKSVIAGETVVVVEEEEG